MSAESILSVAIDTLWLLFRRQVISPTITPQEHTDLQTARIHERLGEHAGPAVPNLIMSLRDREEEVRAAARV